MVLSVNVDSVAPGELFSLWDLGFEIEVWLRTEWAESPSDSVWSTTVAQWLAAEGLLITALGSCSGDPQWG